MRILGASMDDWGAWGRRVIRRITAPATRRREALAVIQREDLHRLELRSRLRESAVAMAGWSWMGGVSSGWTGDKFSGGLSYPSAWSLNHYELRRRARIAYWESVQARALIGRLTDNVINAGLVLDSTPSWVVIDEPGRISEAERQAWTRSIETRFHLWARSKEADATGRLTLYQLMGLVFHTRLKDGEALVIFRYSPSPGRMNPLSLQLVNVDQIQTPSETSLLAAVKGRGNRVEEGIELDPIGAEVAYFVADAQTGKSVRIPKYGPKSGRLFGLHVGAPGTPGEVRAISMLAPILHELQKITDYTVAEIEAAIINATIAAWVEPSAEVQSSQPFAGPVIAGSSEEAVAAGDDRVEPPSRGYIREPGLMVQNLKAGEKLQSYDTKRPNVNFDLFVKSWKSALSASTGIPVEVLDMSFNANYSASRASLILFWNVVERHRAELAADFLDPVYSGWLAEEIMSRRVDAPGWNVPVVRAAWLNCDWIGISKPNIDPKAEALASDLNIAAGRTTRARESRELNGSEFSENAARLVIENEELKKANKAVTPEPVQQVLPQQPREDEEPQQDEEPRDGDTAEDAQ